ncbi:ERF family protein [Streptomyces longhuiensis]|uniref:ERF family protein n=1 Tax=Streptomyces longhuiensis TaxID=2880933 RepID=UPI001D0AB08E|nr:ERF family protein [Streptomyces longhuiensis]UDM00036.1 ERF family protein [Streptomyces longhuiensis]
MTSLTERAEQAATGEQPDTPAAPQYAAPAASEPLPVYDYEASEDYPAPAMVPVHLAWLRVRNDVRAVAKSDKHIENNKVKYHFRGIEAALNAFGPATLRHGINVMAVDITTSYRDTKSSRGNPMRECTVVVTWQILGPKGDSLPLLRSAGESLDSGDKGTAKAQSLALRALLFNTGMIPTGDPEPEAQHVERGEAPQRSATDYRDEIINPKTSPGRLEQISYELRNARMLHIKVANENGDEETLDALGMRHYQERTGGGQ